MDHVKTARKEIASKLFKNKNNWQGQLTRSPDKELVLHGSDQFLEGVDLPSRNVQKLPELTSAEFLVDLGFILNLLRPHTESECREGF